MLAEAAKKSASLPGAEKPGFWQGIFSGFKDMFTPKEIARLGLVFAGGVLSGGSVGGSMRFAAKDTLHAVDARQNAEAQMAVEKSKEASAERKATKVEQSKSVHDYFDKAVEHDFKRGALDEGNYKTARRLLTAGRLGELETFLDRGDTGTMEFRYGIPADSKPVALAKQGYTGTYQGHIDPSDSSHHIILEKQPNGSVRTIRTKDDTQNIWGPVSGTNDIDDRVKSATAEINDVFFSGNKDAGIKPAFPGMDRRQVASQIRDWSLHRAKLGLPNDPAPYSSIMNVMLGVAAKSGDPVPHVGRLLDMADLNAASVIDTDKVTLRGEKQKSIPSGEMGKLVDDVKKPFEKGGKLGSFETPQIFMDNLAKNYEKVRDKKGFGVDSLLQGVDTKSPYYAKIKTAPNDWWAYVYRNMYQANGGK
jgi:hypothetical protein